MVYVPPCFASTYITLNADNSKSFLHFIIGNFLIPTQYKHAFTPALADIPLHDDIDELLVQLDAITDAVRLLAGHERGAGSEERVQDDAVLMDEFCMG